MCSNKMTATMTLQFKATFKGCLEFGNQKSYDMMVAHFQKRLESYYKNDILLRGTDFFIEPAFSIEVPRTTLNCNEKTWKNTIGLLRELRAFAVAGTFYIWISDNNNTLLVEEVIEPQGDKFATTEYTRGLGFLKQGQDEAAIEAFTKAIEKYDRYAQAFKRRGNAYYNLGRYEDALIDFGKSLSLRISPEAYFGKAVTERAMGNLTQAVSDLQLAIDNAVPYQPIFWMARRVKGECHAQMNDLDKAAFELKLVTKRPFKTNDPNFHYRKQALQTFGEVLLKTGQNSEATKILKEALAIESCAVVEDLLRSVNESPTAYGKKDTPILV
jgi:tetratricopeptide (TPR) repeat protein